MAFLKEISLQKDKYRLKENYLLSVERKLIDGRCSLPHLPKLHYRPLHDTCTPLVCVCVEDEAKGFFAFCI